MTTKLFASGATRAMFPSTPSMPFMLRGPTITYAEDDESGGGGSTEGAATEGAGGADDTVQGGDGDDNLGGEGTQAGDDTGSDTVQGAAGDDTVTGGNGNDQVEDERQRSSPRWVTKRIDTLTARNSTLADENARLKRERDALAALGGDTQTSGGGADDAPAGGGQRTYTEEEVERRANEKAALRVLNEKVDGLYDAAKALDPKFETRLPALRQAAGDVLAQRPDFWQALTKFDNGASIMNELTKDLDRLTDLLDMSPVELGIELAQMSTKVGKPGAQVRQISRTPPPPARITETRTPETDLENMDDDQFAQTRAEQRAAYRERAR